MATFKARGYLQSFSTRVPGEHVAGQKIVFVTAAEDLKPGVYRAGESPQYTGKLTIDFGKGDSLQLDGKLVVKDYAPETEEGIGERVFILRPGTPVRSKDLTKLLAQLPQNAEECDTLSVNLHFREEQGELAFGSKSEDAA